MKAQGNPAPGHRPQAPGAVGRQVPVPVSADLRRVRVRRLPWCGIHVFMNPVTYTKRLDRQAAISLLRARLDRAK
jgi:hypothetical protein